MGHNILRRGIDMILVIFENVDPIPMKVQLGSQMKKSSIRVIFLNPLDARPLIPKRFNLTR